MVSESRQHSQVRRRLYAVVFHAETPAGKAFDVVLLAVIVLSVLAVMLESVPTIRAEHGPALLVAEWAFTILFTIEYLLRLYSSPRPLRYARSFFGVIDLLAILPTYASLLLPGSQALIVVRALRLVRIFRVFKLSRYVGESRVLLDALSASRAKITVFLLSVVTMVLVIGAAMYLIEGAESGFTSIPQAVYWAIVTLTTVGYGDIAPATPLGKTLAAIVMILGYGIIAVPTGIVTAELAARRERPTATRDCPACGARGHDVDASFCNRCGGRLPRQA